MPLGTAHRLPLTAYSSPLTTHRLQLTAYYSPLTKKPSNKAFFFFEVPSDSFPISHHPSHHSFLAASNISLLASIHCLNKCNR
jgi:hypothetical protein